MCTDLTLDACDIVLLYGLCFKIEVGFKQADPTSGVGRDMYVTDVEYPEDQTVTVCPIRLFELTKLWSSMGCMIVDTLFFSRKAITPNSTDLKIVLQRKGNQEILFFEYPNSTHIEFEFLEAMVKSTSMQFLIPGFKTSLVFC